MLQVNGGLLLNKIKITGIGNKDVDYVWDDHTGPR